LAVPVTEETPVLPEIAMVTVPVSGVPDTPLAVKGDVAFMLETPEAAPVKVIKTVSPEPEVVMSAPPLILRTFKAGTAVPESVT